MGGTERIGACPTSQVPNIGEISLLIANTSKTDETIYCIGLRGHVHIDG
jgi:hypothetical protein